MRAGINARVAQAVKFLPRRILALGSRDHHLSHSGIISDSSTDSRAIYPWQVSVDINEGSIIGLTALYDPSTPIGVIEPSINERYGEWGLPEFKNGPLRLWRVESEEFAIQLFTRDDGMISLFYLIFGAKHPWPRSVHFGR
jgi:hypothetical protein